MSYRQEVINDSPRRYYRLGESSGTAAVDEMGVANGTYTGGFTLAQSGLLLPDTDKSVALNGTSGLIAVPDAAGVDLADVFTLECWTKLTTLANQACFVDKGSGAYIMRLADTGSAFILRRNSVATLVTSTVSLSTGTIYHLVATKNGATVKLYCNGVDVTGTVTNSTMVDNNIAMGIGAADAGTANFLNGILDDVAVYATALSAARVKAHYVAGSQRLLCAV